MACRDTGLVKIKAPVLGFFVVKNARNYPGYVTVDRQVPVLCIGQDK